MERIIKEKNIDLSVGKVLDAVKTITTIRVKMPENVEIYTDAMDADLAGILKDSLQGCKLSYAKICEKIQSSVALLAAGSKMLADSALVSEDLCRWFGEIL